MAKFLFNKNEGRRPPGSKSAKLMYPMTANPEITAAMAEKLFLVFPKTAKKNKPKIPPLNIDAKAHQASKALSTPLKPSPTNIPKIPMPKEAPYNILLWVFSEGCGWMYFLKWSSRITVAELLMLVEMVLMPAAKMAAMTKPEIPEGKTLAIKKGNTLSAF